MSKYWSERQKQLWDNLERDEQALQRKLNKYYSEQFNSLEKEIGAYYSRYGEGNVIQYQSLLKSLSEADKKQLYRDFESFATRYPEYAHLADVRGSIYKLNRLNGLAYNIQLQQLEIGAKEQELISKHLGGVFSDFYTGAAKAHNFPIDKFSAQSLINKKWANASNFSENIWGNKDKLIAYLNHDFKNGIIRGDNYQKLIKQLRDRFSKRSTSDLRRLVVTEGTYVANQAMMQPFEESGLYDEYKFVALIDSRTSPTCRSLEGQTFKMSEKEVGVNFPPMHPNCRSTFEMVIPEDFVDRYEGKEKQEISIENEVPKVYNQDRKYVTASPEIETELQKRTDKLFKQKLLGSETNVLDEYTGDYYGAINRHLRKSYFEDDFENMKFYNPDDAIKLLDSALDKGTLGQDLKLYRYAEYQEFIALQNQDTFVTYLSTSISETATQHLDDYKIIIRAPSETKGIYIGEYSRLAEEREFLLQRNAKYKIINVDNDRGILEVELYG